MKKQYVLTTLFFLSSIVFLVLFLQVRDARRYERNSYQETLLNFEATDFCLRMALAYCADDMQTIQTHIVSDDLPEASIVLDADATIKGLKQTLYVTSPEIPSATYAIEYVIPASAPEDTTGRTIRQTMLVKKDSESGMWTFAVLAYE